MFMEVLGSIPGPWQIPILCPCGCLRLGDYNNSNLQMGIRAQMQMRISAEKIQQMRHFRQRCERYWITIFFAVCESWGV